MSVELYLAYVLACFVITIIPGPTVTLIVANSLAHGTRSGLLNVAGTQLGLGLMMLVLIVGLSSIIATMGVWFDWLRFIGAAYLIWLGWKLLRSTGSLEGPDSALHKAAPPRGGFFMQGFLVLLGNPKALRHRAGASSPRGSWCCSATRRRCCGSVHSFPSSSIRPRTMCRRLCCSV